VTQALLEGALLGFAGGACGALAAAPVIAVFGRVVPMIGFVSQLGFHSSIALTSVLVTTAMGALAAALPALRAARLAVTEALRRQE
jgi:ABC-type antimicrobial peptide transport system permease subunit